MASNQQHPIHQTHFDPQSRPQSNLKSSAIKPNANPNVNPNANTNANANPTAHHSTLSRLNVESQSSRQHSPWQHGYSRSQPSMPQLPRYASSPAIYHEKPISYFAGQYGAQSPNGMVSPNVLFPPNSTSSVATLSTYHQAQPSPFALPLTAAPASPIPPSPGPLPAAGPMPNVLGPPNGIGLGMGMGIPSPLTASQSQDAPLTSSGTERASAQNGRHHARNSSLSISYIQQKQSAFFNDGAIDNDGDGIAPLVDDEDDGIGIDEEKGSKSRNETEDVWCCTVCTFWNSLLLPHCELCGAKKAADAQIVKVEPPRSPLHALTLSLCEFAIFCHLFFVHFSFRKRFISKHRRSRVHLRRHPVSCRLTMDSVYWTRSIPRRLPKDRSL